MSGLSDRRKPGLLAAMASALTMFAPSGYPVARNEQYVDHTSTPEPEADPVMKQQLTEDVVHQYSKLNKAEAKRYRKHKKALRDQARVAAGMVC